MPADQRWLIDTGRADGGVVANELNSVMPTSTRTGDVTLTFGFWPDSRHADHVERYRDCRAYTEYAGWGQVRPSMNGTPHVVEHVPDGAAVDSVIVDVVPNTPADWPRTDGLWVFLQAVDDPTRYGADKAAIEVDVSVLGTADEWADRTALTNAIGVA